MKTIYIKENEKQNLTIPIVSAVGFFDGLHLGHMALIQEVERVAKQKHYAKALMTFDHYPLYVLGKIDEEKYLTSMQDRQNILSQMGFDYLFVIEFTQEVAALSPEDFIEKYLVGCHIKHVVCGFDFRFGYRNQGDTKTLNHHPSFALSVIDEVLYKGEKISSSRIRNHLQEGKIHDLNELLGRHYQIKGQVIHGRRIGHSIGFPTANIDYADYFLPCGGVYVVKVFLHQKMYLGMCNIGYNPTFESLPQKSLEVHILDFDEEIYGELLTVEFYDLLRKEKPFASQEQLIAQLVYDRQQVQNYFQ